MALSFCPSEGVAGLEVALSFCPSEGVAGLEVKLSFCVSTEVKALFLGSFSPNDVVFLEKSV